MDERGVERRRDGWEERKNKREKGPRSVWRFFFTALIARGNRSACCSVDGWGRGGGFESWIVG